MMKIVYLLIICFFANAGVRAQKPEHEQRVKILLNPSNFSKNNLPLLVYSADERSLVTKDFSLLPVSEKLKASWVKNVKVVQVHERDDRYGEQQVILVRLKENYLDSIPNDVQKMFQ